MATTDVGSLLDDGHWSGYQKLLVGATALTIILDGLDNQLLGAAVPALMSEWGLPRPAFASVLAAGMIGMMIGGFIGGYIGDRIGRRLALLGSVVWFGLLTVLVAFADGVTTLIALRFVAGLGLGGAMPNAAALASEYVPLRRRPFAVTMTIVCIPLGGTLAGFTGALILPSYGWRALFLVGGILPLVLAAVLWKVLPESPRFLARQRARWPELAVAAAAPRPRRARRCRVRGRAGTSGCPRVGRRRCSSPSSGVTRWRSARRSSSVSSRCIPARTGCRRC